MPCENLTGEIALDILQQTLQPQVLSSLQILLDLQGAVVPISIIFEV